MTPRLVACTCDPNWTAMAVCERCEHRQLEQVLERRGLVARESSVRAAFDALAALYSDDAVVQR